jgi:hypothetical protein
MAPTPRACASSTAYGRLPRGGSRFSIIWQNELKSQIAVIVVVNGQRKRRLVTQENRFRLRETPQQAADRSVQEYGLADCAAEFVYRRLQDHPEGDSRHEHWREGHSDRPEDPRGEMERRHLLPY